MGAVRVMAEYECYPLWVDGVGNADPAQLGLSPELASRLLAWADEFEATFDRDDPPASGFATAQETADFNARGRELAAAVAAGLGREVGYRGVR